MFCVNVFKKVLILIKKYLVIIFYCVIIKIKWIGGVSNGINPSR